MNGYLVATSLPVERAKAGGCRTCDGTERTSRVPDAHAITCGICPGVRSLAGTGLRLRIVELQLEGQVRSGQVRSGQVRSGQVRSGQVRSGQVRSGALLGRNPGPWSHKAAYSASEVTSLESSSGYARIFRDDAAEPSANVPEDHSDVPHAADLQRGPPRDHFLQS
jgi:hypothetical protein